MTVRYVNFTVDMDNRDEKGRPKVTKTPDSLHFFIRDLVNISVSVIENGAETDLVTSNISFDPIKPAPIKYVVNIKR